MAIPSPMSPFDSSDSSRRAGAHATNGEDRILTVTCPDRPGLVYDISRVLVEQSCNILESQQFTDSTGKFFMRVRLRPIEGRGFTPDGLSRAMTGVASGSRMDWRVEGATRRPRVLIMVSKFGHCLNDLLFRANSGDLAIDIPAIVSNHPDLAPMADNYRIPFHLIPVTSGIKEEAERELQDLVAELRIDLVVLARYMQILSPDLCKDLDGRAINIHHSMLPSFKGARPYVQAFERGVKYIGATAHYVTQDLDEGPIIEQQVARGDHTMNAEEVTKRGRDNECLALARAVRWHTENRVILDGHRTVVFR